MGPVRADSSFWIASSRSRSSFSWPLIVVAVGDLALDVVDVRRDLLRSASWRRLARSSFFDFWTNIKHDDLEDTTAPNDHEEPPLPLAGRAAPLSGALFGEEVDANQERFSLSLRRLKPIATTSWAARARSSASFTPLSTVMVPKRIEDDHRHAGPLLDRLLQRCEVGAAARDVDAADLVVAAGGEVEVERPLDFAG